MSPIFGTMEVAEDRMGGGLVRSALPHAYLSVETRGWSNSTMQFAWARRGESTPSNNPEP